MASSTAPARDTCVASAMDFRVLSYHFRVRVQPPAAAAMVGRIFDPVRVGPDGDEPPAGGVYELVPTATRDTLTLITPRGRRRTVRAGEAVERLLWEVLRTAFAANPHLVLVHAGSVVCGDTAVVLPGPSGAGKSALVAGLVRAGFSYLSDEVAAISTATGEVLPVPLSLRLHEEDLRALGRRRPRLGAELSAFVDGRWPLHPDDIRPRAVGTAARLGWVVSPTRESAGRLVAVDGRAALADMLDHAFNTDRLSSEKVGGLGRLLRRSRSYRVGAANLDTAVAAVSGLVRGGARPDQRDADDGGVLHGEWTTIPERLVVSPAKGSFHPRRLVAGDTVTDGTVLATVRSHLGEVPVVAPVAGTFLSWLALAGGPVSAGAFLARLGPHGG